MNANQSRQSAIKKAQDLLTRQPVFLDTETTGTTTTAEIVEICILDSQGQVLIDSLVRPRRKIPSDATKIHGISNQMVTESPTWTELWSKIESILRGQAVVIYNAEFDLRLIKQTHLQASLPWNALNANAICLMKLYAEFYGDWDRYRGGYRWHSLNDAGRHCGIKLPNAHRAQADTLLTRELLLYMGAQVA